MAVFKIKESSERTVWAEYGDGFTVEVRHVTTSERRKMHENARKRDWDKRTHKQVDEADNEKFYSAFAKRAIVNWKGLTGDLLRRWVEMDEYPEGEVPYSQEAAAELMIGFGKFDEFITLVSSDLEMAEAIRKADLVKNSLPTHGVPLNSGAEAALVH